MKLTVQIKLLPSEIEKQQLLGSMKTMNEAASYAAQVGFKDKVFGQISIHHRCYYELREKFGLPSQMAVRSIGKAVECFKRDKKTCPVFQPYGAVPIDGALYRIIKLNEVSILTLQGRIRIPIVVGDYFKKSMKLKTGQADLVYKNRLFFLYVTVEYSEKPPITPKKWLGVDLGIVNLATDSTGERFSGKQVQRNRRRRANARKQHQRKGSKNAKRKLKLMSGRQTRFQHQENHRIAKVLVSKAKALKSGIVLEDLKNIRSRIEPTVSRRFRRQFGNWSFGHLRSCIEYKARMVGIPVLAVNPRNSSRTCSQCGCCDKANRKSQDRFKCLQCNYSNNADFNAALNLSAWAVPKPASKVPA